jgi:hypothetical protein
MKRFSSKLTIVVRIILIIKGMGFTMISLIFFINNPSWAAGLCASVGILLMSIGMVINDIFISGNFIVAKNLLGTRKIDKSDLEGIEEVILFRMVKTKQRNLIFISNFRDQISIFGGRMSNKDLFLELKKD